jgi:DNA-directed RNA polymerase beta' subunit
MSDREKKKISSYMVNNGWDINPPEAGRTFGSCKVCHLDDNCTGHYGLLDLGFVMKHPFEKSNTKYNEDNGSMMRYILIPPPGIRTHDDIEWPNDLSKLYLEIIDKVRRRAPAANIVNKINELFGATNMTGIMQLMSGKNGIFRKIVYGKRIESSARSVITGDPTLDIDQVHIPKQIADNLFMKCIIEDSKDEYYLSKNLKLEPYQCIPGIHALRKIRDNDLVFINRQPTLSYGSILTFRAKIRKDKTKTISIHPNVTKTFNADFDGDEMNIFCFPYSDDLERCHVVKFPECISLIQDSKVAHYMFNENNYQVLDRYGLTVSLQDLVDKKYEGTGLSIMIDSKSKGNKKNVEQIMHTVGKQYIGGQCIGTCESSYVQGLNPDEFFLHQKAAREGVVSTGVNTSNTGYINRKGCKIMADVVQVDNIIRDNYGIIDILE